jgi:hypothetical protein
MNQKNSEFVLTIRPLSGAIDAVAEPDAILDKLSPVIPVAGILVRPDPSPVIEPVTSNDPDIEITLSFLIVNILSLDELCTNKA